MSLGARRLHVVLIHHIDDIRAAGSEKHLNLLFDEEILRHCEIQTGELERVDTAVEVLERTKIRLADAILTRRIRTTSRTPRPC